MTNKHYIAMSGSHGCLPDSVTTFSKRIDAVNHLIDLFELPVNGNKADDLRHSGYVELGKNYGAEYAQILECNCEHPEIHGDD